MVCLGGNRSGAKTPINLQTAANNESKRNSNNVIHEDQIAKRLRKALLKAEQRAVLLAQIDGSVESRDHYTRINCCGLGRIRVFRDFGMHLSSATGIERKPLLRGHPPARVIRTQVFQLAGCNWRCWYCYVDDSLLRALPQNGQYVSADELLDLFLEESDHPSVIDLSGGQPDLVPEWAFWVMEAIERRGLRDKVFVWQDDNLSTDLMWQVLSLPQIRYMASFPKHSRVGCFKGFDPISFAYNTSAPSRLFERQFMLFQMLLKEGFDMYAYVTFTAPHHHASEVMIGDFVDRLQAVHPMLPLRTIPLRVRPFAATKQKMTDDNQRALEEQFNAIVFWEHELQRRFNKRLLDLPYDAVSIGVNCNSSKER
jgi:uncharacterized Fe-S cluster-containing radical SAM superfamily protein